ncbi:hypothetical protein JXC34_00265 [Candidatus Woesearchaeota archaeon]|nr:hypothetical protein [Candidatus Woesearchaeota archaeon]
MIIKNKKKFKHKKKIVDKKQEKQINNLIRNKTITEKVRVDDKILEFRRPMFYIEAKELFFENLLQGMNNDLGGN